MRSISCTRWLLLAAILGVSAACRKAPTPAAAPHVILAWEDALPENADDARWQAAVEHLAPLIAQDLVEPRLMELSTPEIRVRGLTDGEQVAFRLEWKDDTADDLPRSALFCDACAIQTPSRIEPDIPAPQMGEPGRPVEIVMWNAAWQAVVDGRSDDIRAIFPNASVDHYPFEAASLQEGSPERREMALRFAPARALGNMMAGPRSSPVEELIAEGPGTLTPRGEGRSAASGRRQEDGWAVVIRRPVPDGLSPQNGSQIAFAVWEGSREEVGARKMRTGWIPLTVEERNP